MPNKKSPSSGTGGGFTFAPFVNFETLAWTMIQQIALSPLALPESADATRVHGIALELVQWFDNVVHSVISTREQIPKYEEGRKTILDKWSKAKDHSAEMECAHELFSLTLETLSEKRLFKIREWAHFRLGYTDTTVLTDKDVEGLESKFGEN